ncbi:hypothetical protein HX744_31910 [Pseudonocardia sp. ICBG1122]|nr:hypothetical protein [Pseudonocardia pini]
MRRSEAASSVSSPPRPLRPGWVPVTDLDDSPLSAAPASTTARHRPNRPR